MKTKDRQIGWHLFLVVVVFLLLMPIVFAISNSFKTMQEAFNTVFQVIPLHPTLENYRHVFDKLPFVKITLNTFLIASTVTIFKTITGLLAAYAFVYFRFKGKGFLYFIMLSTLFIPFTVTMIPNYLLISKIGLRDRIWGVALPQLADVLGIFLLRQAMRGIPLALIEAARMENIRHMKIMRDIVIPLVKTLCNPVEIHANDEGFVKSITCIEMELGEPDASGRRRPIEKKGSEFELDVDTVIMSLGTSPNPLIRSTTPGLETNKHGCIVTDGDDGKTSRDGVYAGGDAVTGAATVIKAMGAGKAAAKAIDEYIQSK